MKYIRNRALFVLLILALLAPAATQAALLGINDPVFGPSQDGFNITRDTQSGLDWLDLSLTDGIPFDTIDAGPLTPAWRRASLSEVVSLFENAGLVHPVTNLVITDLLINLGGSTTLPASAGLTQAQYEQIRDDALILQGLLGTTTSSGPPGLTLGTVSNLDPGGSGAHQTALLSFTRSIVAGGGIIGMQISLPFTGILSNDAGVGDTGHFLVRNSPVPEPGSLVLILGGLLGVVAVRRRERN